MTEHTIKQTPLYDLHKELGGKMVPFAGYEMPVQYPQGIKQEHLHVRQQAGLFDVSHMGQVIIQGPGIDKALEALLPIDVEALQENSQSYAVLTNENGGILDDLIVTRWSDDTFFLVVNAACKEQDLSHLHHHLSGFTINHLEDQALIALQGPTAKEVMAELVPESRQLVFMKGCHGTIGNTQCYITRSGYTGEDGFEISLPASDAEAIARKLLAFNQVEAIGLGARDSLRLEAGLCLYGHDMDIETTPIEASLLWSISKSRRKEGAKAGGFLGAEAIFKHMETGAPRKRVGFTVEGRAPVREGAKIVDHTGQAIGKITSGGFGPSVEAPIAMGYVDTEQSKIGTELNAIVRDKPRPVTVTKTPFFPQRYFRG